MAGWSLFISPFTFLKFFIESSFLFYLFFSEYVSVLYTFSVENFWIINCVYLLFQLLSITNLFFSFSLPVVELKT